MRLLLRRSEGRGGRFSRWRGLSESVLERLYGDGWAARLWATAPGATTVQVLRHRLPILPPGSPPLRIGYASDLHLGPTTPVGTLLSAAAALRGADVDLLLLGGDYVFLDATDEKAAELAAWVQGIGAPRVLAVPGNHDLWARHDRLEQALSGVGVEWIHNRALRLAPPHEDVAVFGLDDPWTGAPDPARALAECGEPSLRIGLVHSPDGLPLLLGKGVALVFSGHTHGGQVALPGGRPLWVPGPAGKKWPWGRHDVEGTVLLVSRGIGGVEIPIRLWAPPDVLVVDLVAVETGG